MLLLWRYFAFVSHVLRITSRICSTHIHKIQTKSPIVLTIRDKSSAAQAPDQAAHEEMAVSCFGLTDWLRARPGMVPVPLFRDTLLIYLGFTWLGQRPMPVFINRAFANTWSDNRPVHDSLAEVVCRVLLEHGACSLATMRRCFAGHIQEHGGAVSAPGGRMKSLSGSWPMNRIKVGSWYVTRSAALLPALGSPACVMQKDEPNTTRLFRRQCWKKRMLPTAGS